MNELERLENHIDLRARELEILLNKKHKIEDEIYKLRRDISQSQDMVNEAYEAPSETTEKPEVIMKKMMDKCKADI